MTTRATGLVTEELAIANQCVGPSNCGTAYVGNDGREYRHCVASNCLAWRFARDGWLRRDGTVIQTTQEPRDYTNGGWVRQGYCGLIGEPKL